MLVKVTLLYFNSRILKPLYWFAFTHTPNPQCFLLTEWDCLEVHTTKWVKGNAWICTACHCRPPVSSLLEPLGVCVSQKCLMLCVLLKWVAFSFFKDPGILTLFLVSFIISACKLSTLQSLYLCVCVRVCDTLQKAVKTNQYYTITRNITLLTVLFSYFSLREASLDIIHVPRYYKSQF